MNAYEEIWMKLKTSNFWPAEGRILQMLVLFWLGVVWETVHKVC